MMDTTALITFFTALFFLEITPGPDMMLVLARGIGQGRRIALLTAVGQIFVSGTVQVSLLVLGVASLLQAHPSGLAALQWTGAAYLIYLGAKMLRSSMNGGAAITARHCTTSWQAVREGAVCNLTNPKSLLFMFAFLPQFVDPGACFPVWGQLLVLGSIQKLTGIFSLGGVAVASGTVGQWLYRWPHLLAWQKRFTGLVMLGLGLRLLLTSDAGAPGAMAGGR
ncbi:MAG: LysE family translocator [Desulfobacteraceae bacterium]|nr:LysE family translocator [Desulfobacteraceae bacterium]